MSSPEPGGAAFSHASSKHINHLQRRALVRAGLASGVLISSLSARSVLAQSGPVPATTISMWNSIAAKGPLPSQTTRAPADTIDGPDFWLQQTSYPGFVTDPANTSFTQQMNQGRTSAGFDQRVQALRGMTLPNVLRGNDALARYCVAMFLNAKRAGNVLGSGCVMTDGTAQTIWANNGSWQMTAGSPAWTRDGTLAYFAYICDGTRPWPT